MMQQIETLVKIAEKDPNMCTTPCECKGKALHDLFEFMWRGEQRPEDLKLPEVAHIAPPFHHA
jgi:hypothetical protein